MGNYASEERIAVRVGPLALEAGETFGWAVGFGMCVIAYYLVRAFFNFTEGAAGLIGWIPGVGDWVKDKIEHAEQKVTHWIGQAAVGSERRMGDAFHAAGNELVSIGHEIFGLAVAYAEIAKWVGKVAGDIANGEAFNEIFHNDIRSLRARTKLLEGQAVTWPKDLAPGLQGPLAGSIETHVKPVRAAVGHIGTLDLPTTRARLGEQGRAIPRDYPSTRDIAHQGEQAAEATWKYLLTHPWAIPTTAFAGAVAVALGRFGAGWFRCSNWNRLGRGVCRMPFHWLDDLLGLIADFAILASICQVLPWLEAGASAVATPMIDLLSKAGAGLCQGATRPDPLVVPSLYLPAAGGTPTLHLP